MSLKNIDWSQFEKGKEYDVSKLTSGFKGLKFISNAEGVRFIIRLTYEGKKISQSLGSCSHSNIIMKLKALKPQVEKYHRLISQKCHPFAQQLKPQVVTFGQFAQTVYLVEAKSRKKSYGDDESRLRMHIAPVLGNYTFKDITSGQLSQLIADLRHQKKLSNATINRVRALLSSIFNMAIDHELIETNPVLRVKKYKENNQKERYLNDDELKKLMNVLSQPTQFGISNLVIVAVIKFLLLTGVRKREALDMQWTDVDLKTGVWLLSENKSGKARRIHLNQDALSIVHQMSKQHRYIFANPQTGLAFNDIRKTFDKVMAIAGIDNMRIHDLRHNFASLAVNSGQSLYVVQHLLGHASPQTTQRYAHLQSDTLLAASEHVASKIREAKVA